MVCSQSVQLKVLTAACVNVTVCRFPWGLIPDEGWTMHQEFWLCCHSRSLLLLLPVAFEPRAMPPPSPGPPSGRNLNKPVPFTSNSIHHLLLITSNQQCGRVTRFYLLFLLIRNLPLDRWTPLTLLMWRIFSVWYMLIPLGDCSVKLWWLI